MSNEKRVDYSSLITHYQLVETMQDVVVALDIGTTKVCALVGEIREGALQIIGMGLEPSRGMRKSMVVDVSEATLAIAKAVERAEQTSGYDLSRALVSVAGEHIGSLNSRGMVAVGRAAPGITTEDIERALDAAQAISIPHNRQVLHLLPRSYAVDDQDDVRSPIGMYGYRLDVGAHIVTAATPALLNLSKCAENVGIKVEEFVLNALASAEAVLEPAEREMGVIVADVGGGTTDVALYVQGAIYHTAVVPLGGYHVTNDIAVGLRIAYDLAEKLKIQHGDCRPDKMDPNSTFTVEPFSGEQIQVGRQDLATVIEARVEEIFQLIGESVRQSGYEGLIPAGLVLTGGAVQLRGVTQVAQKVLGLPARVATPRNLVGLVDSLHSPAYATAVGLLRWAMAHHNGFRPRQPQPVLRGRFGRFIRELLPG
ncbi:MAG: cell division protein FtsA [Chloroflexota bacterium]